MTRTSLALAFALALSLGCDRSPCDEGPEIAGTATFEGQTAVFDRGSAIIHLGGPAEDPCVDYLEVSAENETVALTVIVSLPAGAGPSEVGSADWGHPVNPYEYFVWIEDLPGFSTTYKLEELHDDCARASLDVTAASVRMGLSASEDWGPYELTDVDLSVNGTWSVEWHDRACG